MRNVSAIHNCFGCGVCTTSCPKKIISLVLNKDGFYEPHIADKEKCIDCGVCLDVCAYNHKSCSLKQIDIKSWAAWSNNDDIRRKCSSGGVGFEIGKQLIEEGYKVVGCRYDTKKQRAEHYIANTAEELIQTIGSKYIQSYTEEAFRQIKLKGEKYLITGTPCQIDSFRRMIQKFHCEDNFILLDFFCHCVPSMFAWEAYLKMNNHKTGKVLSATWRNKDTGWHDSWVMKLQGSRGTTSSWMSKGDMFYRFFLGDLCLGPQCQNACKYKWDKSSADVRIGDLWGGTYKSDQKGVSALVSFTSKGQQLVDNLLDVTLVEHPFEIVAEGQMKENAKKHKMYDRVMWLLKHKVYLSERMWKVFFFVNYQLNRIFG